MTGGYTDYGQPGDKVQYPPVDRPNNNMIGFIESVQCHAGAAFGLARAYTLLRADSSYTSFRGDMILSWAGAFYPMQKWLERCTADWVAVRALRWAMRKGFVPMLPEGWEQKLSWTWPTMPEVNETDAQTAVAASLKNGTTDYSQLLGPEWRKKFEALSEQMEVAKSLGLPLSMFETKSGGTADGSTTSGADGSGGDVDSVDAGTAARNTLSGVQITAAIEIITKFSNGEITEESAIELMVAVGILRDDAVRMIEAEKAEIAKRQERKEKELLQQPQIESVEVQNGKMDNN
jgi:hypothetical protein